jgi:short-subunit dehydrogenase
MLSLAREETIVSYRTALITGASSGIGRALSARIARDGAEVVLCARRRDELESLAKEIRDAGGRAHAQVLDVANADATVETVRRWDRELGGLDLVIANAGIGGTLPGRKISWERVAPILAVNFHGAIATLTAALPEMLERNRGHLVGVSSLAAYKPLPASATYCATKCGLSMFLEALRFDLQETGVRVTTIHPGFVRTPMTDLNAFPMPFMVELEDAIDLIARRLPKAPATIDFPASLTAAIRVARMVPRPIWALASRRQPLVDRG